MTRLPSPRFPCDARGQALTEYLVACAALLAALVGASALLQAGLAASVRELVLMIALPLP
ncbi:MAG: hypothetical protein HYV08_16700 [Deltaproteobacteria bacterium]|nr:hypothetical protein [Deltaproteobacteria bacterium]MBI3075392.1 hypothetical protein [Deltaproteobacteria bacterium]